MFGNLKLGTRLAIGFSVVLLLLSALAYTGVSRLTEVSGVAHALSDSRIPELEQIYGIMKNFDISARSVRNVTLNMSLAHPDDTVTAVQKESYDQGKGGLAVSFAKLEKELNTPQGRELFASMKKDYLGTLKFMDKAMALDLANQHQEAADVIVRQLLAKQAKFLNATNALAALVVKTAEKSGGKAVNTADGGRILLIVIACIAIVLGSFTAFFITRSVTKPLERAISGLNDAAAQVASASVQVSSASQQLAEGASEQAASIEETSSSLEEMASMTKLNSEHANRCKALMHEARKVVEEVNTHMNEMDESIGEISRSSEETVKIVKTIDEIAFQTNLLALNAAVEAARAGESGAGFAVVADEVRNLAMRAAEAAKNTTNLIDNTIRAVREGNSRMALTRAAFAENMKNAQGVDELVGEIAAASREQSEGIGQINKAVSQMDRVVQQNSASAEESASASEEMDAQARQLKELVARLALVAGNANGPGEDHCF